MSDQNCGMPDNCICGRCEIKVEHFDEPSPVDYEAKIKSLQAEIAELKQTGIKLASQVVDRDDEIAELKKPQWVSVDKFNPEKTCYVWVKANDVVSEWVELINAYVCPEYGNVMFETLEGDDYIPIITEVTPLPPPPEAE